MGRFSGSAVEESAEYYSWQAPDSAVDVRISAHAVDRILADAMRGLGLVPRRGAEVGGLLLGVADGASVTVDDVLTIPIEYAFGPSYILSERDKENLRATLSGQVVGFYRTQTRDGLSLTPQDHELFSEFFPDPYSAVLVIRPRPLSSSVAALFRRENGKVGDEPSYLEFPARTRNLGDRLRNTAIREDHPEPPRDQPIPELPSPSPELPESPQLRLPLWVSWWVQIPILTVLLLVNGFMGFLASAQVRPAPAPARKAPRNPYALSLLVVEHRNNLHLTWDHEAPALASAASAVLSITDGNQTHSLDLSPSQLRDGSVVYNRHSGRVRFRLEVLLKDKRSVSETWDLRP